MLSTHEVAYWPWKILEREKDKTDERIDTARRELWNLIARSGEDPHMYEWDVMSDRTPVQVAPNVNVEGIGTVPGDRVIAGVVVAWRKGTPKPKITGNGQMG